MADPSRQPAVYELDGALDPAACCEQLAALPGRIFLDSAARGSRLGRYSFLAADPVAIVRSKGPHTEVLDGDGVSRTVAGDALDAVKALLAAHQVEPVAGVPRSRVAQPGILLTTGAACSSGCRRRATTIWRCPTSSWASTTGSSRGITTAARRG